MSMAYCASEHLRCSTPSGSADQPQVSKRTAQAKLPIQDDPTQSKGSWQQGLAGEGDGVRKAFSIPWLNPSDTPLSWDEDAILGTVQAPQLNGKSATTRKGCCQATTIANVAPGWNFDPTTRLGRVAPHRIFVTHSRSTECFKNSVVRRTKKPGEGHAKNLLRIFP